MYDFFHPCPPPPPPTAAAATPARRLPLEKTKATPPPRAARSVLAHRRRQHPDGDRAPRPCHSSRRGGAVAEPRRERAGVPPHPRRRRRPRRPPRARRRRRPAANRAGGGVTPRAGDRDGAARPAARPWQPPAGAGAAPSSARRAAAGRRRGAATPPPPPPCARACGRRAARAAAAARRSAVGCGAGAPLPPTTCGGRRTGAAAPRPSVCVHRRGWLGRYFGGHDARVRDAGLPSLPRALRGNVGGPVADSAVVPLLPPAVPDTLARGSHPAGVPTPSPRSDRAPRGAPESAATDTRWPAAAVGVVWATAADGREKVGGADVGAGAPPSGGHAQPRHGRPPPTAEIKQQPPYGKCRIKNAQQTAVGGTTVGPNGGHDWPRHGGGANGGHDWRRLRGRQGRRPTPGGQVGRPATRLLAAPAVERGGGVAARHRSGRRGTCGENAPPVPRRRPRSETSTRRHRRPSALHPPRGRPCSRHGHVCGRGWHFSPTATGPRGRTEGPPSSLMAECREGMRDA